MLIGYHLTFEEVARTSLQMRGGGALQVGPTIESCIKQQLMCLDVFGQKIRISKLDNLKFFRFILIRPCCRLRSLPIWVVGENKKYRIHHSFGSKLKSRKCRILHSLKVVSLRSRKCRIALSSRPWDPTNGGFPLLTPSDLHQASKVLKRRQFNLFYPSLGSWSS